MSARSVQINLRVNFPVILFAVLFIHALCLSIQQNAPTANKVSQSSPEERTPLNIKSIRMVGARDSQIKDSAYLAKTDSQTRQIVKERVARVKSDVKNLSLKDLTAATPKTSVQMQPKVRPGTRPETQRSKAITGIGLKGSEMRKYAQGSSAGQPVGGDPQAASLSNSDISVNLEVPEGVSPDELNKYELMFYGFQRRTAINYINSFYKRLDKFQQANPHLNFPMTGNKQVMTGRLTYDEKGNIKQIKMVRWSNTEKLQDFFVEVLKEMDTLHNPPHALWEKTGEFSIFFSFVVNG
ncbi:MAG TPA: hypothetical protein VNJ08_08180 [Bacteriovoracaceae bacterium]|nr:hypothetical protein [Bacteriovoracaceae bacterium]